LVDECLVEQGCGGLFLGTSGLGVKGESCTLSSSL
jgi:hypothetical protein